MLFVFVLPIEAIGQDALFYTGLLLLSIIFMSLGFQDFFVIKKILGSSSFLSTELNIRIQILLSDF